MACECVIGVTTSHSTKPANGQVAGYPAQAGIQQDMNSAKRTKLVACGEFPGSPKPLTRYAGVFQSAGFPPARE